MTLRPAIRWLLFATLATLWAQWAGLGASARGQLFPLFGQPAYQQPYQQPYAQPYQPPCVGDQCPLPPPTAGGVIYQQQPKFQQPAYQQPYQQPYQQQRGPLVEVAPPPNAGDAPRALKNVPPAVARIRNLDQRGGSMGSATLIDKQGQAGIVLTCWHTFRDGLREIEVVFTNGQAYRAALIDKDEAHDLAVFQIAAPPIEPIRVGTTEPAPGEFVYFGGYGPRGAYVSTTGRLTTHVMVDKVRGFFNIQGSAREGDSGGPVFNGAGQLVGVVQLSDDALFASQSRVTACGCQPIRNLLKRIRDRLAGLRRPGGGGQAPPNLNPTVQPDPNAQANGPGAAGGADIPPHGSGPVIDLPGPVEDAPPAPDWRPTDPNAGAPPPPGDTAPPFQPAQQPPAQNLPVAPPTPKVDGVPPVSQAPPTTQLPPAVEDGATALVTALVTKGLTALGVASGPAGLAALGVSWLALRRVKKHLAGKTALSQKVVERVREYVPVPVPSEPVERPELRLQPIPTTDHEYARLLKAIQHEATYDPQRSGPVAQRILSLYQQLSSGEKQVEKMRTAEPLEGQFLGWNDRAAQPSQN